MPRRFTIEWTSNNNGKTLCGQVTVDEMSNTETIRRRYKFSVYVSKKVIMFREVDDSVPRDILQATKEYALDYYASNSYNDIKNIVYFELEDKKK